MARVSREEAAGAIHHVIPAGDNGGRIVEDDRDRASYLARFARIRRELGWLCHASCLMDTHHHAVAETPMPNLGLGMRRSSAAIPTGSTCVTARPESVFVPHFWPRRLADEAWFFRACLYTVLNPVAAGLCRHPREWRWCSYRSTAEGDPGCVCSWRGTSPEDVPLIRRPTHERRTRRSSTTPSPESAPTESSSGRSGRRWKDLQCRRQVEVSD